MLNIFSRAVHSEFYSIEPATSTLPLEYNDLLVLCQFSSHPKTKNFQRSIYNFLDFIGDVGGLLDGLKLIGQTLLFPITKLNVLSLLLSKIFTIRSSSSSRKKVANKDDSEVGSVWQTANEDIRRRKPFPEAICKDLLASCCWLFMPVNKRQKRIKQGERRLEKYLDIVNLLKN